MPPSHIRIGGAGIAGASTARHLAELGMSVSVYDPVLSSGKPATQGASHIPHTVLHSRLLAGAEPAADLRQAAFHYTAPWQRRFTGVRDTGALQLQGPNLDEKRLERLCESFGADAPDQAWWIQRLSPHRVAQKLHLDIEQDALWFPTAGVTHLPELCKSLLDHPLIETVGEVLTPDALQPTILCTGIAARDWPGLSWLELQPVAGQLDCYELSNTQFSPTCAVVGNGYVVPASDHNVVLGATYEYSPWPAEKSHTIIADMNDKIINVAAARRTHTQRGVRAVSSDRTPIVGQVEDNLWLNTGMGSMGTTMAPLGASVLAAEFMGWPSGLQPATRALLRPERFIERQQRRGFRHGARPVSDS